MGPISASSFAAVTAAQPGSSSSAGAAFFSSLLELLVELCDLRVELATGSHELACELHLHILVLAGVKEQTINRWYRHGAPTGQQPWNPDGWIDEGPRKKRLQADALNLDALTEPQRNRSVTVRQRRATLQRATMAAAS